MSTTDLSTRLDTALDLQRSGQLQAAAQGYRDLFNEPAVAASARLRLALLDLEQGRLADAAAGLAQALAEQPDHPDRPMAVRVLGLELNRHGYRESARTWLEEALIHFPDDEAVAQAWQRSRPPAWLAPEVYDPVQQRSLYRASPREGSNYVYTIDIVGTCNLRCPSCPVGNRPDSPRPKGFMPLEKFAAIIDKILDESPADQPEIWLFNWGEPLLHPDLPAMVELLNERGLSSFLSSNLNINKGLDALIAAGPGMIKISLSGFSEASYARTHTRGKLDRVKENMHELRRLIDQHRAPTRIWVGQHVYRHNLKEVEAVAELCRELDFDHRPIAAFYQPLEKLLDIAEGRMVDEPVLRLMLEHPAEYLPRIAAGRDLRYDCELRANQTVINHDGQVALCCSVYEPDNQLGLDFLSTPRAAIEDRKYSHPTCARCYRAGLAYLPSRLANSPP